MTARRLRLAADALDGTARAVSFTARAALLITLAMPYLAHMLPAVFPVFLQVST